MTCTTLNMPFGFNGMWRSNTTGLSFMRNRWYSPQLGQFMSHDPLEYIDSYDLYAFAKLDPINFWDPFGLQSWRRIRNHLGGNRMEGSYRTPMPDMRLPDEGKVRLWLVEVKIQGKVGNLIPVWYFNHSYLITRDRSGRYDNLELVRNGDKAWFPQRNQGNRTASPLPDESDFRKLWIEGEIEMIYETEVKAETVEKMQRQVDQLRTGEELDYSPVSPTADNESNCHKFVNSCLDAMDLPAPKGFQSIENPGSSSKHPLPEEKRQDDDARKAPQSTKGLNQ